MTLKLNRVALWLGLAIIACYIWSVTGTYHFDDSHSVEGNLAIRSLTNIPSFWTDTATSSFIPENRVYRPLVYTFYSLCWFVGKGSTLPFHLVKMFMHLMVCLGIFQIWRRLWSEKGWFPLKNLSIRFPFFSHAFTITSEWAAFFLALLFAVHPAGSECVDYISATTSLQCAMFYIWAYCAYLSHRDTLSRGGSSKVLLGSSIFLFFLSVASKEEGITLPAMVFITEIFLLPGALKEKLLPAIRRTLPYAGAAVFLATWIYVMHPVSGNESRGWVTWNNYFVTQWRAYLWYMRLWFWPWDLNADNAAFEFSKSILDPRVLQAFIGNSFVLAVGWFNRKRFPALLFGLLWFYVTISPASSVIVLAEAVNEHRMYLAYVGFVGGTFTVLLYAAEKCFAPERRSVFVGGILAVILVGLVIGTQERNRVWANDENLWSDTVEKNPTSGRALNNLALVHMAKGDYLNAVALLERCELHWSSYMYCPLNKAISLEGIGNGLLKSGAPGSKEEAVARYHASETALLRAYSLNPHSVHVNFHLGRFNETVRKDCGKAIDYYRASIEITGGRYPAAESRLADCYTQLGRHEEAGAAIARALEIEPDNQSLLLQKARLATPRKLSGAH